jgi:hypothetical protein
MRILFTFMYVLALGMMGCSKTVVLLVVAYFIGEVMLSTSLTSSRSRMGAGPRKTWPCSPASFWRSPRA